MKDEIVFQHAHMLVEARTASSGISFTTACYRGIVPETVPSPAAFPRQRFRGPVLSQFNLAGPACIIAPRHFVAGEKQ
jgi:hypothetical protein